jgi:hypothetical protein
MDRQRVFLGLKAVCCLVDHKASLLDLGHGDLVWWNNNS